jgi:hypothetical protein
MWWNMVKGSLMRKLTLYLFIASLAFTAGVASSYLEYVPFTRSTTQKPEVSAPLFAEGYCELHGSLLKPVLVQRICGEYHGKDGSYVRTGCDSGQSRQIAAEDAPFLGRGGSLRRIMWLVDNDGVRERRFPHGYGWEHQDCESGVEPCITVESCEECRAAEVEWKKGVLIRGVR